MGYDDLFICAVMCIDFMHTVDKLSDVHTYVLYMLYIRMCYRYVVGMYVLQVRSMYVCVTGR